MKMTALSLVGALVLGAPYLVLSAPPGPQGKGDEPVPIVSQEFSQEPDGAYKYSYETANGINGQEVGTLKKNPDPKGADFIVAQGSYSYTAPDGTIISLKYAADDEQGFVPQGDHLPTPPPIPPAIQKALEYIAAHSKA